MIGVLFVFGIAGTHHLLLRAKAKTPPAPVAEVAPADFPNPQLLADAAREREARLVPLIEAARRDGDATRATQLEAMLAHARVATR